MELLTWLCVIGVMAVLVLAVARPTAIAAVPAFLIALVAATSSVLLALLIVAFVVVPVLLLLAIVLVPVFSIVALVTAAATAGALLALPFHAWKRAATRRIRPGG